MQWRRSVVKLGGVTEDESGQAIKLFRSPRKISFTFHFWHMSFVLHDAELAELSNNSFERKNVTHSDPIHIFRVSEPPQTPHDPRPWYCVQEDTATAEFDVLFAVYYKQTADKTKVDLDEHHHKDVSTIRLNLRIAMCALRCRLISKLSWGKRDLCVAAIRVDRPSPLHDSFLC